MDESTDDCTLNVTPRGKLLSTPYLYQKLSQNGSFIVVTQKRERRTPKCGDRLSGICYTRTFGIGRRHFEPWSSDEDDT
ncbi:hypothetical protein TNCV_2568121 [Trichonephila clavipes]|uniref:Uncharacterized protein n=1 Tax=Trichonephila clavipes TaxID=2585209 RepID=A0A8X6WLD4_TRICX|nr:hypothetical protein TNCV_2568121 [Trichonephila clavipes]